MTDLVIAVAAYFIGTFPSAYLFGMLFKQIDIRQIGSGNVGAMNTLKSIGYLPGLLTLAADIAKGALAVYIASRYGNLPLLPVLTALLVILGHNYNIFLRFKGGKGLGSLIGALLVLTPVTIIYLFGIIGILALIIRDMNTASGLGIFVLPVLLGLQDGHWLNILTAAAISLVIMIKHLPDFQAYKAGRRRLI